MRTDQASLATSTVQAHVEDANAMSRSHVAYRCFDLVEELGQALGVVRRKSTAVFAGKHCEIDELSAIGLVTALGAH
jgi:hypothetical protein